MVLGAIQHAELDVNLELIIAVISFFKCWNGKGK